MSDEKSPSFSKLFPVFIGVALLFGGTVIITVFQSGIDAGDKIASVTAAILGCIAFPIVVYQLHLQSMSAEIQSTVEALGMLRASWDRVVSTEKADLKKYYSGELLSSYEAVCFLFNNEAIKGKSRAGIEIYVNRTLHIIFGSEDLRRTFIECMSHPDVFEEIFEYIRRRESDFESVCSFVQECKKNSTALASSTMQ